MGKRADLSAELPIVVKWLEFSKWVFDKTEKFPKRSRFTFADRINNHALDFMEELVEAKYTGNKLLILRRANLRLEKMRFLFRLSHESRMLSWESYEFSAKSINEVGKMLGGWIKNQQTRE